MTSQRQQGDSPKLTNSDRSYHQATTRSDLAWRIAQRVAEAQRRLSVGQLEAKEIRNAVDAALREHMEFVDEGNRVRWASRWLYVPVDDAPPPDKGRYLILERRRMVGVWEVIDLADPDESVVFSGSAEDCEAWVDESTNPPQGGQS